MARWLPWQQVFNNSPSPFCGSKKLSDSSIHLFLFFFFTCKGKLLLPWVPQEPVYCRSDWGSRTANVISLPWDISIISSQAVTHSFTHSVCSFVSDFQSDYPLRDIWLLVMCYFCFRPLASVSLSILTETGQSSMPAVIQTQSQVFCLPVPCPSSSSSSFSPACTFLEPAAKRSKQHNAGRPNNLNTCRLAVTAVTRLTPLLNSGCVKCCVMLHYVQRQDAFSLVSNPTPVVLCCGQVALDIHGDFQTSLLTHPELKTGKKNTNAITFFLPWFKFETYIFHYVFKFRFQMR